MKTVMLYCLNVLHMYVFSIAFDVTGTARPINSYNRFSSSHWHRRLVRIEMAHIDGVFANQLSKSTRVSGPDSD